MADYDVIVVGADNAALASAMSALESGADMVLVLEKAPKELRGGNTHWSDGILRFAFDEPHDIEPLLPGVEDSYTRFFDGVQPYTEDDFMADLMRVTRGRSDPELSKVLVGNSRESVFWAHERGAIPMEPARSIAGVEVDGVVIWPKGALVRFAHEGVGLSASRFKAADKAGVEIRYDSAVVGLVRDGNGRVALAQPLYHHSVAHPRIQFHSLHPPPFAAIRKGLSLTDIYAGATRLSGRLHTGSGLSDKAYDNYISWWYDANYNVADQEDIRAEF